MEVTIGLCVLGYLLASVFNGWFFSTNYGNSTLLRLTNTLPSEEQKYGRSRRSDRLRRRRVAWIIILLGYFGTAILILFIIGNVIWRIGLAIVRHMNRTIG